MAKRPPVIHIKKTGSQGCVERRIKFALIVELKLQRAARRHCWKVVCTEEMVGIIKYGEIGHIVSVIKTKPEAFN